MNWFEEQIDTRRRLDEEDLEDAYAHLAASVMGSRRAPRYTLDDAAAADSAVGAVVAYYGTKAAEVPPEVTDPMDRIDYALRPTGIMRRPVRLVGEWWKDATGAYLATLKDGSTPVAVIPAGMRGYGYIDPTTGQITHIKASTAHALEADALCFYRPLPLRELSGRDLLHFVRSSLGSSDYAMVALATIVSTAVGMLPAVASGILFGRIIPSGLPSLVVPIAALLLGVTVSRALIDVVSSIITNRLGIKLQVQMEAAIYARILLLPPDFFREYAPGDLANRTMVMTQIVTMITQTIAGTGLVSIFSLAYVFQILAYAPQLVVPALLTTLLEIAASVTVTYATIRYSRAQMKAQAQLSGLTPALLHAIQKIKLAGAERRAFAHWSHAYAKVTEHTYNRPALLLAAPAIIPLIGSIGTIVIYFIAATTHVSVANYMAFNTAFGGTAAAVATLPEMASTIAIVRAATEMIAPILHAVPEMLSNQRQVTSVTGAIEVSNLSFRYSEKGPLILDDLSLCIRPKEYVAIVGKTGCGKSTLMRLLLGFEKPTKGAIYYSSYDIANVDIRSLRKHIGVVMQSGSLFQGDLLSNITVATPKATLDDAWEAAELAGVADDIRKMPMGMQTLISEGSGGVSGGQKQRIMIARAICGKPKILMLDEATSALDNITQRHVSDALASLSCTRIVIAHRLSTITHADRIIMLEDGKIVEDGSYDELVARGGKFAHLVERQRLEK